MNRYLGNKTGLLEPILGQIGELARPGSLVCDAFSGTLAVSLALKKQGYLVASNDVNPFSRAFGRAFLANREVPEADLASLLGRAAGKARRAAESVVESLRGSPEHTFLAQRDAAARYVALVAIVQYLAALRPTDVAAKWRRSDFFETYCEEGQRSAFVSARGRTGRRKFFSPQNARHIDAILSCLRRWRHENRSSELLHATLTCVLIDAVERVSNTQGTYHDFPRDETDPRALRPMRLEPPSYDGLLGTSNHIVGNAEDSLEFVRRVPPHEVLYLDPPYNFRQYTSYYFLPNVIARYAEIDDLDDYFSRVEYVRGQNMADDFDSPFCKSGQFVEALGRLIARAKARTVVLSYFDGRNHWNDFKSEANGIGFEKLSSFFCGPLFEAGSMRAVPIPRMNYQSYGGYKSRAVKEFLFVARKAQSARS